MGSKQTISNCRVGGNITQSSAGSDTSDQKVSKVKIGGSIVQVSTARFQSVTVDGVEQLVHGSGGPYDGR